MGAQVRDAKAISALEEKAGDPLKPWIKNIHKPDLRNHKRR